MSGRPRGLGAYLLGICTGFNPERAYKLKARAEETWGVGLESAEVRTPEGRPARLLVTLKPGCEALVDDMRAFRGYVWSLGAEDGRCEITVWMRDDPLYRAWRGALTALDLARLKLAGRA